MRVIAGKFGGRRILMDDMSPVRPTSDKARGALFSSLAATVPGSLFLDIFAGTGAVGIEALSRGAAHVTAIEKSRSVVKLLQSNMDSLGIDSHELQVMVGDFRDMLPLLAGRKFDCIFADPPYYTGLAQRTLELAAELDLLNASGVMVIEHFSKETLPVSCGCLLQFKLRRYGQTSLSFYRKRSGDE